MARKTIFLDDLDESLEADAGTLTFALEGQSFEIDLSKKNATKLRSQLGPWMAAARRTGSRTGIAKKSSNTGTGMSPEQRQAVKDWARSQGMQVSDKGRIAGDIMLAFEQSKSPAKPPADKAQFSG